MDASADALADYMQGFPHKGVHTRAGWAVEMLRLIARREDEGGAA